jgi:hypothetical protein
LLEGLPTMARELWMFLCRKGVADEKRQYMHLVGFGVCCILRMKRGGSSLSVVETK